MDHGGRSTVVRTRILPHLPTSKSLLEKGVGRRDVFGSSAIFLCPSWSSSSGLFAEKDWQGPRNYELLLNKMFTVWRKVLSIKTGRNLVDILTMNRLSTVKTGSAGGI